jgi:hypothetical protein
LDIIYRDLKPENILLDREVLIEAEKKNFDEKFYF